MGFASDRPALFFTARAYATLTPLRSKMPHRQLCRSRLTIASLLTLVTATVLVAAQGSAQDAADLPQAVELGTLTDAYRAAADLYCGPQPRTEKDFASLAAAGIKTVICVDGVAPLEKLAQAAGLRCVHVPVGFSDAEKQVPLLLAAMSRLPGPVYIHCRYGRPRTPIVVAMIGKARYDWTPEQVTAWLDLTKPGDSYLGLQKSLTSFQPPTAEQLKMVDDELKAKAETTPLVHAMGALLEDWDQIRAAQGTNFTPLNAEKLKALAKNSENVGDLLEALAKDKSLKDWGADFVSEMSATAKACDALGETFRDAANRRGTKDELAQPERLSAAVKAVGARCGACHSTYRN